MSNNRDTANAVALRETLGILEKLDYAIPYVYQNRSPQNEIARLIRVAENKVRKALAAPQRNCDRFATVDEARKAFQEARGHKVLADVELWDSMDEAGALVRWLFATMKENGGNKQ